MGEESALPFQPLTARRHGGIISAMASVYTTPPHLRPVQVWRLHLPDGAVANCLLGPTTHVTSVAWYLNDTLQDGAGFEDRKDAERWAEDVRRMLTAVSTV